MRISALSCVFVCVLRGKVEGGRFCEPHVSFLFRRVETYEIELKKLRIRVDELKRELTVVQDEVRFIRDTGCTNSVAT